MTSAPILREMRAASNPPPAPPPNHPHHVSMYTRIAVCFVLLAALVLGLVAYVVLSHADVVVLSTQQPAEADFVLDISEKPAGSEVPGVVLEQSDSLKQTFPATSVVKIDSHAEGRVRITSALSRPQHLVATTRLLTPDGILFRIKDDVTVPSFGSKEADVFADLAGSGGEVGNVATFAIPGLNPDSQRFFKVQTVTPIIGGTKEVRMVTKKDIDAAEASLKEKLGASLTAKLRDMAHAQDPKATGEFVSVEVTKRTTDAAVGSEKTEFTLDLVVKAIGTFYEKDEFDLAVAERLKGQLPRGRNLLAVDKETVTLTIEKIDIVGGRANLRVNAKGLTVLSAEEPALLPEKLVGVSVEAARQYLQDIDGVASASVKVSPFWVKRLPNVADHIRIEVR